MSQYLDKIGLQYFWQKIKTLVNTKQNKFDTQTVTLLSNGWISTSDGLYSQSATISSITTNTSIVFVDVALSKTETQNPSILKAWSDVASHHIVQGNGIITFYASTIPSVNIPLSVGWSQ